MQVLGVHFAGTDAGVSLWEDGRLIFCVEAERLTRERHEPNLQQALQGLLDWPSFSLNKVGLIASTNDVSYETLKIRDASACAESIRSGRLHTMSMSRLLGRPIPCAIISHEACHAALATHYAGYKDGTLVLVNEIRGRDSRSSLFNYANSSIELRAVDPMPWFGNGFGYAAISALAGLGRTPAAAERAMAMAAFAEPDSAVIEAISRVARLVSDFDEERRSIEAAKIAKSVDLGSFAGRASLAQSFQYIFTRTIVDLVELEVKRGCYRHVALAGDCALNTATNSALKAALSVPLSIPPACNDAGQAIGAAVYAQHFILGLKPDPFSVYSVGLAIDNEAVDNLLLREGLRARLYDPIDIAAWLTEGKVVALAQGHSECGPRALGNRSLLGGGAIRGMKNRISEGIKGRDWYRPLSPVVKEDVFKGVFPEEPASPHKLFSYDVSAFALPEASHVDLTARIQTVSAAQNSRLYEILDAVERMDGSFGLINTSLNITGQPIAHTPKDVLSAFGRRDVDVFVLGDRVVSRADLGHVT